uniref:Uncharacterized protein n=1 Tax=Oryza meridionalis TaxID=40149 RepID=A0A0E0EBQ0_9ORYZ
MRSGSEAVPVMAWRRGGEPNPVVPSCVDERGGGMCGIDGRLWSGDEAATDPATAAWIRDGCGRRVCGSGAPFLPCGSCTGDDCGRRDDEGSVRRSAATRTVVTFAVSLSSRIRGAAAGIYGDGGTKHVSL